MKLTGQEARDVVYDEADEWSEVKGTEEMVDQRRWVTVFEKVFLHVPSGKYYRFCYEQGSTECQESCLYEYEDFVEPVEVELKEVTVSKWVPVGS
jgi:hypothetical protein